MAILPVSPDDVEFFTTIVNPTRSYSSGTSGVTGSIQLFARGSEIEKEVRPLANFQNSYVSDDDLETFRIGLADLAKLSNVSNISFVDSMETYLQKVDEQQVSPKKQKKINIIRFSPGVEFDSNSIRKINVKNTLMSYYRTQYPSADWAYTNYNCLNFFASPSVPTSSVLLYPITDNAALPDHQGYVSGSYALSGGFSFDFYINPRYQSDGLQSNDFNAGTIFHFSSSYALSLITGSRKDINGNPDAFRLQLQLSHSADIPPSQAIPGSYPSDLVFLSDDNALIWNEWSRVVVRWGTSTINDGTGSFNINGIDRGHFVVPSGTIMPLAYTAPQLNPSVLCVGNYYEGVNQGNSSQSRFFTDIISEREGLTKLYESGYTLDEPTAYAFNHPLNAEISDLKIRRKYLNDTQIEATSGKGTAVIDPQEFALYVPPFFVEKTPIRKFLSLGTSVGGGVLQTPFFTIDGSTDDPFNVAMSFGVGGHYINLENFVKDFANNVWPRMHHLSATIIDYTTQTKTANEFLYEDPFVRKRNLTVLPCDNGSFVPNYNVLSTETGNKLVDSFGRVNLSLINLDNLLNQDSLLFGSTYDNEANEDFMLQQVGFSPSNPGLPPGPAVSNLANSISSSIMNNDGEYGPGVQKNMPLVVYQRTKDPSSNQITFFDISNLYFGTKIIPGTFQLTDSTITGSAGKISITLKDDGNGNIYRSDSSSPICKWNSAGNIFYNEGIVLIKSPHLYFFGKEGYELSFKGEYHLHSAKYEILAPLGYLNSSSNPTYAPVQDVLRASGDPIDEESFVYISNINLHDKNLNVLAKAVLAQPIIKRDGDKILFKFAIDY